MIGVLCSDLTLSGAELSVRRPNFVVIMSDDLGYGDVGCFGGTAFPTPEIDRMATAGIRFTDFHSSGCVCSPTRAGLLTGRYQQRAGVDGVIYAAPRRNRHHGLQLQELTFAELLKKAGYRTAAIGKWHLGYERQYNPVHQGFDHFVGYVSGNVDFHTHIDGAGFFDWWHQDQKVAEAGYTTHLITSHAEQFIRAAVSQDQPFCLYVAHEAPHDPYQGPGDPPVRKKGQAGLVYNHRQPDHAERAYADMMRELDAGVGQLLDVLEELEIANNTLVLFFSDNGATGPGSCGGLYGMKGTLWEGGHRVPFVAQWKNHIPAGTVSDQLASTIDIMPTLLELAGLAAPKDRPLDGTSLQSFLVGGPAVRRQLYWKYADAAAMRDGDLKLVLNGGPPRKKGYLPRIDWDRPNDGRDQVALFDLTSDLSERHNLADQRPGVVRQMRDRLTSWMDEVARHATTQPEQAGETN